MEDIAKKEAIKRIINLRREALSATLKLFGFADIDEAILALKGEYNPDNGYRELGRVGYDLENYIHLAPMFRVVRDSEGNEDVRVSVPEDLEPTKFSEMCNSIQDKTKLYSDYMAAKDELLDRARGFSEDVELGMREKLTEEEWSLYESQVKRVINFYLGANYDLLSPEQQAQVNDYTEYSPMDILDEIADIIDVAAFSKAVNIEDRFVSRESAEFSKEVQEMVGVDERIRSSSPALALLTLKKVYDDTKAQRDKSIKNYEALDAKYTKSKEEIERIVGDGSLDQADDGYIDKLKGRGETRDGR